MKKISNDQRQMITAFASHQTAAGNIPQQPFDTFPVLLHHLADAG